MDPQRAMVQLYSWDIPPSPKIGSAQTRKDSILIGDGPGPNPKSIGRLLADIDQ